MRYKNDVAKLIFLYREKQESKLHLLWKLIIIHKTH